jgi:hypothetical protein
MPPTNIQIKIYRLQFCLLFYMDMELSVLHYGKNMGCQCLGTRCWVRYLDLWGGKGGWRESHNEELYDLYSSPNAVMAIKSERDGWRMCYIWGRREMHLGFWRELWRKETTWKDPGVHGFVSFTHSNESFPFIKSGKFLNWLRTSYFLNKGYAPYF